MLFLEFFSFHWWNSCFVWDFEISCLMNWQCYFVYFVYYERCYFHIQTATHKKKTHDSWVSSHSHSQVMVFFPLIRCECVCVISQRHILFINRCRFDLHSIHQGNWIFGIQSSNSRNLEITRTIGDVLSLVWLPNRAYSSMLMQIAWNSAK